MVEDYAVRMRMGGSYLVKTEHYGKRIHKTYGYKEIYRTKAGDFTPEEWKEKLAREIRGERLENLLESIKLHCSEHCAWMKKESEIEEYAMDCLASGAYKHWEDFNAPERTVIWM